VLCQKVISYEYVISLLAQYNALHNLSNDTVSVYLRIYSQSSNIEEENPPSEREKLSLREYEVESCEESYLFAGRVTL